MLTVLSKALDIVYTFLEIFCMYRYVEVLYERRRGNVFFEKIQRAIPGGLILCYVVNVMVINSIVLVSPFMATVVVIQNIVFVWIFWKCDILNAVAVAGGYFLALLRKCSEITCDKDAVYMFSYKEENRRHSGLCQDFLMQ